MADTTEVLIIGGGPGGYTAAFRAADLGKQVTIVESRDTLGGVCLNVGCIPSKSLLHLAEQIVHNREISALGVRYPEPEINLTGIRSHRDKVVGTLTKGLAFLANRRKVTVVNGTAVFTSASSVSINMADGKKELSFDDCIIAAGSRPVQVPGIPYDDKRIWTSTDALALESVPERLLILGAGVIGLEMATVYHALGSEITVVEMMDQIIPGADRDLVGPLQKRLKQQGIKILTSTRLKGIKAGNNALTASWGEEQAEFDVALISVGRRSNADKLELDKAGVQADERSFITVDATMRTSVDHIYAVGDIVGQPMLAHKASHQGKVAAEVIAGKESAFIANAVPAVAYTTPEIAWTGLTEREAKEKGVEYKVGKFPWSANGRALSQLASIPGAFSKVLFDKESGRVIGAAICGANAGELIGEATLALEMGADAEDLGHTIHPHPTLSETLAAAAEAAAGSITEL